MNVAAQTDASPHLASDALTRQGSIAKPSAAVELVGHLREGSTEQHRRLYENLDLIRWIEILVDDIVDPPATGADDPAGQSVIWVRRDADVAQCETVRVSSYEFGLRAWPRP